MLDENTIFTVKQKNHVTIVENQSKKILVIYRKPINNKRKLEKILIVLPCSFMLLDEPVDLKTVMFSLQD